VGNILVWAVAVPAIAGGISYLCGKRLRPLCHVLAIAAAAFLLVVTARLVRGPVIEWDFPWGMIGPVGISAALKTTTFGTIASVFVAGFGLLVALYGVSYVSKDVPLGRHHAYMLWALSGAVAALLANNLLFFVIAWEVVTLMLYLLIGLSGERARKGAAKTFAILGLSDCAMLLGIVLLLVGNPHAGMKMDAIRVTTSTGMMTAAYLLMLVGALAKAGAVPFHTWLPSAAESADCDVLAFLPASLDKLLGIYLLARISLEIFTISPGLRLLLMAIGAVTIIAAVMMAMIQHDLKKLLSFHAVSQVGYMVLGIGTGTIAGIVGGVFHMINNAVYKSALFLGAGSVERATKTTELSKLGGLARTMPVTFICMTIAALAISGIPPLNGFASKWLVYQGALAANTKWAAIFVAAAVFGSALTLASFVKVLHSLFLGQQGPAVAGKTIRERPMTVLFPLAVLAAICVVFGIFARSAVSDIVLPCLASIGVSADTLLSEGALLVEGGALWSPGTATALLILGIVTGVILYLIGAATRVRVTRTFLGGEVMEGRALHTPGTSFYNTVRQLPILRGIFHDAEREAFDVYHIGGRYGNSLVQMLRSAHTGALTLYVSWVLTGLVILIVCFFAVGA